MDSEILDLKESKKNTDEQFNKTIKKFDEIGRQLGDLGMVGMSYCQLGRFEDVL